METLSQNGEIHELQKLCLNLQSLALKSSQEIRNVHANCNDLKNQIKSLQDELAEFYKGYYASGVEIDNKLEGMLRQKIEEEVNQLRTEIQTKLDTLKKDMQEEMRQLQRTVQAAAPPAVPLAAQTATPASLYAVQRQR